MKIYKLLSILLIALYGCSNSSSDTVEFTEVKDELNEIYSRPFHLTYANMGGKQLTSSDEEILNAFRNMPVKPTMALQVILNKTDPSKYKSFLTEFNKIVPNMFFGLGKGKHAHGGTGFFLDNQDDWDWHMLRARNWRSYTDCISIEGFNTYVDNASEEKIIEFLKALSDLGYKHIVANPWTAAPSGEPWPYIDGAWQGIRHLESNVPAFYPKIERAKTIKANSPQVKILINYENSPGHLALTEAGAQGSCDLMQIAVDAQIEYKNTLEFFWAPPWTSNYEPIQLGSWEWIVNTYESLYK